MISIKRYLEQPQTGPYGRDGMDAKALLPVTAAAYHSALVEMGESGMNACPVLGGELKQELGNLGETLRRELTCDAVMRTEAGVREQLRGWGRRTAKHYRQQSGEVKEILLMMARAAESVGERDQRCAEQITEVTARLKGIAHLEDLTEMRESIKKSAFDLKRSIDRITAEGKAAMARLRAEVTSYQTRLEAAEEAASRDALTGLRCRLWVEGQIEQSLREARPLCVAILDINEFKQVNDLHSHHIGDLYLQEAARRMKLQLRSHDLLARLGGDEFAVLLPMVRNRAGVEEIALRLQHCFADPFILEEHTLQGSASFGIALYPEDSATRDGLLNAADTAMYAAKKALKQAASRSAIQEEPVADNRA